MLWNFTQKQLRWQLHYRSSQSVRGIVKNSFGRKHYILSLELPLVRFYLFLQVYLGMQRSFTFPVSAIDSKFSLSILSQKSGIWCIFGKGSIEKAWMAFEQEGQAFQHLAYRWKQAACSQSLSSQKDNLKCFLPAHFLSHKLAFQ